MIDAHYTTSGMLDKSISLLDIARCRMYHFFAEQGFFSKLEGKFDTTFVSLSDEGGNR